MPCYRKALSTPENAGTARHGTTGRTVGHTRPGVGTYMVLWADGSSSGRFRTTHTIQGESGERRGAR